MGLCHLHIVWYTGFLYFWLGCLTRYPISWVLHDNPRQQPESEVRVESKLESRQMLWLPTVSASFTCQCRLQQEQDPVLKLCRLRLRLRLRLRANGYAISLNSPLSQSLGWASPTWQRLPEMLTYMLERFAFLFLQRQRLQLPISLAAWPITLSIWVVIIVSLIWTQASKAAPATSSIPSDIQSQGKRRLAWWMKGARGKEISNT